MSKNNIDFRDLVEGLNGYPVEELERAVGAIVAALARQRETGTPDGGPDQIIRDAACQRPAAQADLSLGLAFAWGRAYERHAKLPRWIPVTEQLPDPLEVVLVLRPPRPDGSPWFDIAARGSSGGWGNGVSERLDITHWQPLPPPDEQPIADVTIAAGEAPTAERPVYPLAIAAEALITAWDLLANDMSGQRLPAAFSPLLAKFEHWAARPGWQDELRAQVARMHQIGRPPDEPLTRDADEQPESADELIGQLLESIQARLPQWLTAEGDLRYKLEGAVFAVLCCLDGVTELPAFDLVPSSDEYAAVPINRDIQLHNEWSRYCLGKLDGAPKKPEPDAPGSIASVREFSATYTVADDIRPAQPETAAPPLSEIMGRLLQLEALFVDPRELAKLSDEELRALAWNPLGHGGELQLGRLTKLEDRVELLEQAAAGSPARPGNQPARQPGANLEPTSPAAAALVADQIHRCVVTDEPEEPDHG